MGALSVGKIVKIHVIPVKSKMTDGAKVEF